MTALKAAGKKPKVTIVAVMRKMITTLNAMLRDDVVWADRLRGRHSGRPYGSGCADRFGRVKAVAARSAGAGGCEAANHWVPRRRHAFKPEPMGYRLCATAAGTGLDRWAHCRD